MVNPHGAGTIQSLPTITSREINRLYATIILVLLCDVMCTWLCPIHPYEISQVSPIDYIGLYLIVIGSSMVTVNWLYRLYF